MASVSISHVRCLFPLQFTFEVVTSKLLAVFGLLQFLLNFYMSLASPAPEENSWSESEQKPEKNSSKPSVGDMEGNRFSQIYVSGWRGTGDLALNEPTSDWFQHRIWGATCEPSKTNLLAPKRRWQDDEGRKLKIWKRRSDMSILSGVVDLRSRVYDHAARSDVRPRTNSFANDARDWPSSIAILSPWHRGES